MAYFCEIEEASGRKFSVRRSALGIKNSVQIEKLLLNSVARHLYLETFALYLIKIAELNCFKCSYMYLQVTHQLGLVHVWVACGMV